MERYQNVIIDTTGNAIPSVTVTVYEQGTTTLASIYSTNSTGSAKANPFTSSSDGGFTFYAPNGRYDIKLTKTGYTFGTDLYDILLLDPSPATFVAPA